MAEFFKTSTLWVVDFRYRGRARRWLRTFAAEVDAEREVRAALHDLYGDAARFDSLRRATPEEEAQYRRGERPLNACCATGGR